MPAGKRRQSNAMLYTLITFVALFVVATTAAVIYYVQAEELRTRDKERQDEMNRLVSQEELRNIGGIVGTRLPGHSSLGSVVAHLDHMVGLVRGTPVRTTSAEVKAAETHQAIASLLERVKVHLPLPSAAPTVVDPNAANADPNATAAPQFQVALTTVVSDLLAKLEKGIQEKNATEQQMTVLRGRFDDAIAVMEQTKNEQIAKVTGFEQQVNEIKANYDQLRASVEQSSRQQLSIVQGDLEKARIELKQFNDNWLRTQAELNLAQTRLAGALTQVSEIRPAPDKEAPAFKSDGRVVQVDQAAGVIHIDIGSDDRVYQGLTFSIYDRAAGIPRDGKPKAQVEVFAIEPKVSAARVLSWDRKNPIASGDLIANLIWDTGRENRFVVIGDFDLDSDGRPDYDAAARVEVLIRRWGGAVAKEVTAQTDYMILGTEPKVPPEPTLETQTADPTAQERYDAARQRNEQYNQLRQRAEALHVPIFSYDRFLYFTGYASQANKPGAL